MGDREWGRRCCFVSRHELMSTFCWLGKNGMVLERKEAAFFCPEIFNLTLRALSCTNQPEFSTECAFEFRMGMVFLYCGVVVSMRCTNVTFEGVSVLSPFSSPSFFLRDGKSSSSLLHYIQRVPLPCLHDWLEL